MRGLCTDLYELKMAAVYLRRGMTERATFSLFVRTLPPERGFLVAAGLADALDLLEDFRFDEEALWYLARTRTVPADVLAQLRDLRFTGDVWAVPEGRVVFAGEPLLEVTAPIAEAQLVETAVLNLLTHQTAVASKAARCRLAAGRARLVDFSFRRTQGLVTGIAVARAAVIAGFDATSNVAAAARYGLVAAGTMAHSFVQAFRTQRAAFDAFAAEYPTGAVFLVDTYDTPAGVRDAVAAARSAGMHSAAGVRIDSGDLAAQAFAARRLLDAAGMTDAQIMVSGGLDEHAVEALVTAGAPIDAYGVGTAMGVSADAPSLDSAYKLVQYGDRPVMKLSAGKATLPGPKQVFRSARLSEDVLSLRSEPAPAGALRLLLPVMRAGRRTHARDAAGQATDLEAARGRCAADLADLPDPARRLRDPVAPEPRVSPELGRLGQQVRGRLGAGG